MLWFMLIAFYIFISLQLVVGNSDVGGIQCFCSVVSKMVYEYDRWALLTTHNERVIESMIAMQAFHINDFAGTTTFSY